MDSPQLPCLPRASPQSLSALACKGDPAHAVTLAMKQSPHIGLSTALCKQAILSEHHRGHHPGSSAPGLLFGSQALTDVAQLGSERTRPVSKPMTSPKTSLCIFPQNSLNFLPTSPCGLAKKKI
ncbi:hypothetical protein D623_10007906 [Myotis brandtii]|uniref:Uncharacterized protein n=1 Tax=Myotis brandtii TaxID=109478 RepID=S7P1S8_MYOBR|nr:hypothetical protein D623_10007906 [Myotis brandtii]